MADLVLMLQNLLPEGSREISPECVVLEWQALPRRWLPTRSWDGGREGPMIFSAVFTTPLYQIAAVISDPRPRDGDVSGQSALCGGSVAKVVIMRSDRFALLIHHRDRRCCWAHFHQQSVHTVLFIPTVDLALIFCTLERWLCWKFAVLIAWGKLALAAFKAALILK